MRHLIAIALLVPAPVLAGVAAAEPEQGSVELRTIAEKEVRVVTESGEVELRRVPAAKVVPGDEVIYTIQAKNISADPVSDIVITDPIPEHTTYRDGSATRRGSEITFSVDGGTTFAAPEKLQVTEADGAIRPATASDYTHVRWNFRDPLPPGESRSVGFRTKLQ